MNGMCLYLQYYVYRITCKKLIGKTPFRLFYGVEVVMPMEYIVPNLEILEIIDMDNQDTME